MGESRELLFGRSNSKDGLWEFEFLGYISLCDVTSTIHKTLSDVFTNAQYVIYLEFENIHLSMR